MRPLDLTPAVRTVIDLSIANLKQRGILATNMSLDRALGRWELLALECEKPQGEFLGYDDYVNELTLRKALEEVGNALPEYERTIFDRIVGEIDNRFRNNTVEASRCLHQPPRWYYKRIPKRLNEELRCDLLQYKYIVDDTN